MVSYSYFNTKVIYPWLIPDYCYYDIHETTWLVDLFFDFPGYEGYHPVPSTLGYVLFGGIGGFIGYKILKP